ncbi:glycoside hydrolase family 78 protein [Limibacterium fermenti]|uniref:glycoside hydrolase family 78 protein n=1 Tax=Limibacterium fermenti TaxID=3229863 RepID=UPI003A759203
MKFRYKSIVFLALLIVGCRYAGTVYAADLKIVKTTCEYQESPLLVDDGAPRFGWMLESEQNGSEQSAYALELYDNDNKRIWASGKIRSHESQHVKYIGNAVLVPGAKYHWRVRVWDENDRPAAWSEKNSFRMAPASGQLSAKWVGAITKAQSRLPEGRHFHGLAETSEKAEQWRRTHPLSKQSIYLRKSFAADRKVADAIVYVSGLGHYELTLNGEKTGDDVFNPLWSDYDKTVYYNAYDVTRLLKRGENVLGVLLGNGFYNEQGGRYKKMQVSFGPPTLLLTLQVTYADGTKETITSDEDWKYAFSPLVFNDMYGGEDYDARLEQDGWNKPGFDDSQWQPVVVQEAPSGTLLPQQASPVKEMDYFPVKSMQRIGEMYVLDMGQNLSGYPVITVKGQRGAKIRLTVAERLNDDGSINQSQSGAPYYYEYTLKGGGEEKWRPRFSYYGYRYIQIEGAKPEGAADTRDLPVWTEALSCFVYNSAPSAGSFHCSNELFNDVHRIIVNAIKSNMQAVFTDCPHREKLGWLEQLHLNGPGLFYNFNLTRLVPKILRDMQDAQLPNGLIPDIAPEYVVFEGGFRDSPEWGSAAVVLPFMYYQYYGDPSLVTGYYEMMKRYVDYLSSTATGHIVSHGLGDWYDYHPELPAGVSHNTPVPLVATAHYYMDIVYLAQAAEMAGRDEDARRYSSLAKEVKKSFNETFFDAGRKEYGTGSQASNALPLFLDLVEPAYREEVLNHLVKDIEAHGYKLTTGDVGNRYLFRTLADNGLNEVMYTMHNHRDVPGYGFQIQFGATTLTEQWDPRKGNSWNHFMMGPIEEWFYRSLAGIRPSEDHPGGFGHFIIAPEPVGDLSFVRASHETLYGTVRVEWQRQGDVLELQVEIPVNCTADIVLPGKTPAKAVKGGLYRFREIVE